MTVDPGSLAAVYQPSSLPKYFSAYQLRNTTIYKTYFLQPCAFSVPFFASADADSHCQISTHMS
jgi:hypothetical protein